MAEIAANITQISHEGASPEDYVFATNTVPPSFAVVTVSKDGYFTASGPLTKEQLEFELQDADAAPPISDEEYSKLYPGAPDYGVHVHELQVTGDYPGGRGRAALNLARLVLGG
jgi:hypothetical protein